MTFSLPLRSVSTPPPPCECLTLSRAPAQCLPASAHLHSYPFCQPCLPSLQNYSGGMPAKVQQLVQEALAEFGGSGGGGLVRRLLTALAAVGVVAAGESECGG